MDLMKEGIGKEGEFAIEFKDGKLRLTAGIDSKGIDGGIYIDVDGEYFLDKLAEAIPGTLDDVIIATIKSAMK